ncbi:MAG TPA: 30S ribosomal protein S6--L-glutamate ligase, partial [Methylomirabilota bacterium]|nr:30S ribosomal protein S6--L-glutamate ligase [Methylomirabilota bacterium]
MRIVTLSSGTGWHVQDLRRAAAITGHELVPCAWKALSAGVADGGPVARAGDVALDDADAVLLRTMPPGSLEQIVFRMDAVHGLHERGVRVVNPPRAIEVAVDKYLALRRLADAGLPVPPTITCQTLADARAAFAQLGGDAVVKPLFGSEGFGLTRVCDADVADRVFAAIERIGGVIYLQRFIDHGGSDLRLLVLAGRVLAAMRRRSAGDWRTNVARGGRGEPCAVEPALAALALRAAAACD